MTITNRPACAAFKKQRGGALLAVLWLSAALAAVAFSIAGTVKGETERTATAVDDVRTYYLATGAIARTILRMQWGTPWFTPNQPVIDYDFPTGQVHVQIIPEAAKLDINQAPPDQLFRLLSALTHNEGRAQELTQTIVDWRSPAGKVSGTFDSYYLGLTPSFLPRHASLEEIEELLAVKGMTPDVFYGTYIRDTSVSPPQLVERGGLRDCISIFGAVGVYDVNGVAPALMESVGVSPQAVQSVLANRPFLSAAQYGAFSQGGAGFPKLRFGGNSIFTIRATARLRLPDGKLSDLRRTAASVIKLQPQKDPAYVVLRWYDRG